MATFKKKVNTPALFRALAELSEKYSASETSLQLENRKDVFGGHYLQSPDYVRQLSVSCMFREDLQELWLEVGRLYEKYGGDPADLLTREEIRKMRKAVDVTTAKAQSIQEFATEEDELSCDEWDIVTEAIEKEIDPFGQKQVYYVRALIQRKDRKMFQSLVDKKIRLAGLLFTIVNGRMIHSVNADGSASASTYVLCKFEGES